MARRPSVLKREREKKLAERAAIKREERARREASKPESGGPPVATYDELAGYGLTEPPDRDED